MDKEEVQGFRIRMDAFDEAGVLQDSRGFLLKLGSFEPGAQGPTVVRLEAV